MVAGNPTSVVSRPRESGGMSRGVHTLVGLLRPTLGHHARAVASASVNPGGLPEVLDSGGLIARRMYRLPDAEENLGAMFLRDLLLRVYERAGDGVATTSVIFEAAYVGGCKAIASGLEPVLLQKYLRQYLALALAELDRQRLPAGDGDWLSGAARTTCGDLELANEIGDLFAILGPHGTIEVRSGQREEMGWTLIDGAYWDASVHDSVMLIDQVGRRADLQLCTLLVSDLDIVEAHDMVAILEKANMRPSSGLVIVARSISPVAMGVLMSNSSPARRIYGVSIPEKDREHQEAVLVDLAILTGARALRAAAGDSLKTSQPGDFGRSRRAWITRTQFGIISPGGDARAIRNHVRNLRASLMTADEERRSPIARRLARMTSSSAILWVSGPYADAIDRRKELAERTILTIRGVMTHGVLPGAGAAFLACKRLLSGALIAANEPEAHAAIHILVKALEAPARAIAINSGHEGSVAIDRAERAGEGFALDARTGTIVDTREAGILDSWFASRMALECAVNGAAQALTIDTLVLR